MNCFKYIPLLLVLACQAEYPVEINDAGPNSPHAPETYDPNAPVPLSIDYVGGTTSFYSLPLHGVGPSHGIVSVNGPKGETVRDLSSDGTFCVDVELARGAASEVTVQAWDHMSKASNPIIFSVQQSGEPPESQPDEPVYDEENIADGPNNLYDNVSIEDGSFSSMFDSTNSYVTVDDLPLLRSYINFDLSRTGDIRKLLISSPSDCPIEEAIIYLSNDSSEQKLTWVGNNDFSLGEHTHDSWYEWARISNPGGDNDLIVTSDLPNGNIAHRIAIEFLSHDCGGVWPLGRHKISDIRVMAVDPDSITPVVNNDNPRRCDNGG